MHSSTGCLDEAHHLFLAEIPSVGLPDRHESILSLEQFDVETVGAMIADGRITDGPTLGAFLRAGLRGHL